MQNHLDSSQRTFSSMLQSDPFGPPSHDFSLNNHNSGSPGSDFGHLLNSSNHNHSTAINNNHLHHNNNNNHSTNNNSGVVGGETKPKKAPPPNGKKTKGRVKIKMEFIDNKLRRYTTFSKRKTGIMKKAYELSTLTGTQVMLLVASETGHVYTFATRKLQPMITSEAGKALIQTCLNSPDPPNTGSDAQRMSATGYEETELTYAADPNASDHGDVKDDDSETGSSDGEDPKEVPPLLPLSNGLLPSNFAALLASATVAGLGGGTKGGLTIDSLVQGSSRLGSGQFIVTSTPSSATSQSPSSLSTSTNSTTTMTSSSSANHHHSNSSSNSSNSKSHYKIKREVVK